MLCYNYIYMALMRSNGANTLIMDFCICTIQSLATVPYIHGMPSKIPCNGCP